MSRALIATLAILSASCLTAAQEQSNNESIAFPLRPALATQQLQGVSEDSETCSLPEAQSRIEKVLVQFLQEEVSPRLSLLVCTSQVTGLVAHCPANSCSQVFDLIHEGFLRLSSYYWLQAPHGDVTEVYCNSSTMQPEYSSCQQLFMFETVPSGIYTI